MKTFELLSTFRRVILHRVQIRHDVSGAVIPSLQAEVIDGPPAWSVAVVNGDVVVAGPEGSEASGFEVVLTIEDPAIELFLDTTAGALNVPLTAAEAEHHIAPAPQRVEISLIDQQRQPIEGRTITIGAQSGPGIHATTEVEPGTYHTADVQFDVTFNRFRVRDDGAQIGEGRLMSWQTATALTIAEAN